MTFVSKAGSGALLALAVVLSGLGARAEAQAAPTKAAAPPPLIDYARYGDYQDLSISPNGKFLAAKVVLGSQHALVFLDRETRKITGSLRLASGESVADYWWTGPQQVVASLASDLGILTAPAYIGELVTVYADSTRIARLTGWQGEKMLGSRINGPERILGWSYMEDPLENDPTHAIIQVVPWRRANARADVTVEAYRIHTWTGERSQVAKAPFRGDADFLADHQGVVRYVAGVDHELHHVAYGRADADAPWVSLQTGDLAGTRQWPLKFSADDRKVYLASSEQGDRTCLVEHHLADNVRRSLACHDLADLSEVLWSFDGKRPIAAVFDGGRPEVRILDDTDSDARVLAAVFRSFPGQNVRPVSRTSDGGLLVLLVSSDRNPGDYYLFDTKTRKAQYLVPNRAWIDPARQAQTRVIEFDARDGTRIQGYLTLPAGAAAARPPLVVHPHGGPIAVRDEWGWSPEVQMLASRGYAVLQVNFRGSDGFGRAFRDKGKKAWGTAMIDDVTDAVRWVIAQDLVDAGRIGIYGVSYGGYAALTSAVREPALYRSVVALAGVYDLIEFNRQTDIDASESGRRYLDWWAGSNEADLRAQSPITQLDRLRAPVMIAHGGRDDRTPVEQAKRLRAALKERGVEPEWFIRDEEGHGFALPENRAAFYERMLAFLDRTVKAAPAAPTQ